MLRLLSIVLLLCLATGLNRVAFSQSLTGPETGLPMPRFVSIKAGKANLRAGPGRNYPIRWVYKRRNLPVQIHDEHGHWRAVTGPWGGRGWLHKSLLSGRRTALVTKDLAPMMQEPSAEANIILYAEQRVIGTVELCQKGWCRMSIEARAGWIDVNNLFGGE